MYRVKVRFGENEISFAFNQISYATEFAGTCLECGDEGTEVLICFEKEE